MRQSYTNKFHSYTYVHAFNILYNKQGQLEKSLREVPVRTSLLSFEVASKQNKRLEKLEDYFSLEKYQFMKRNIYYAAKGLSE